MAEHLRIALEQIEYSFDTCRRKTVVQALLDYRLNRLCDQMSEHPGEEIGEHMKRCGLLSVLEASLAFEACFGLDIAEYRLQCSLALTSKYGKPNLDDSPARELIGDSLRKVLGELPPHCA